MLAVLRRQFRAAHRRQVSPGQEDSCKRYQAIYTAQHSLLCTSKCNPILTSRTNEGPSLFLTASLQQWYQNSTRYQGVYWLLRAKLGPTSVHDSALCTSICTSVCSDGIKKRAFGRQTFLFKLSAASWNALNIGSGSPLGPYMLFCCWFGW